MPKVIKGESSRKPPVPGDRADIETWITGVMPAVAPIVTRLDALIRELVPNPQYAVKWSKAHYGVPRHGWIIELAAYHVSVNVVFYAGADFDPPPPEGTTGRTRYVKVRTINEAEAPELRRWIVEAARVKDVKDVEV